MDDVQKRLLAEITEPLKKAADELKIDPRVEQAEKDYNEDYKFARKKIRELFQTGEEALEEFMQIAKETKEPAAFKVITELLKTMNEMGATVVQNAKTKSEIDKNLYGQVSGKNAGGFIQNNAIFTGSAQDIIDIVTKETKKLNIIESPVVVIPKETVQ